MRAVRSARSPPSARVTISFLGGSAAGAGRAVDGDELALGPGGAGHRDHCAGGGLVVGPTDQVDALFAGDDLGG